jgi:replication factor C small subunit
MTVNEAIWVEKYRPESLDDIIGQDAIVERLKKYAVDEEVPHMIFAGPPGVGKTAAITAFAKEVYGDSWRTNLAELNASDERGIDVIRDKVKGIARSNPAGNASFKIIFLDEADQLSSDAQPALRRIMEDHSSVTRFFLSCNYPNRIITPLQSRCSMFRFARLDDDDIRELLQFIAGEEDLEVDPFAADKIIRESRGDARTAINTLQSATIDHEVTEESVSTVVGVVNQQEVQDIIDLAIEGDLDAAMTRLNELLKSGANTQMLADTFLRVIKSKNMPAPGRAKCIDKLSEVEWRIIRGANPHVQWHSFLCDVNVGYHLTLGEYEQ